MKIFLTDTCRFLYKYSGSFQEYLQSLHISPEVISEIEKADDKVRQFLINEVRKNPQINVQQLQQLSNSLQQTKENPWEAVLEYASWYIVENHRWDSSETKRQFKDWLKYQFYKMYELRGKELDEKLSFKIVDDAKILSRSQDIRELMDWVEQTGPQLSSYNLDSAIVASGRWHETLGGGEGEYKATDPSNIVFGPQWPNKEGKMDVQSYRWQGWTVQRVPVEDLKAEGNKMGHCVGGYARKVKYGRSTIYSLRDPSNEPHVTIETDGSGETVYDIEGKGNKEPKQEYKNMIRRWIRVSEQAPKTIEEEVDPFYRM